jgi:tRNA pseudouridine55 synthase
MIGVVNLDKPVGPTSHDMVGLLRRITGTRRIGHAGTLDPLASGVLPILIGAATRFSEELTGGDKAYRAVIRLGFRSATDDAQGPLTPGGPLPSDAQVTEGVARFVGTIAQRPPAFSARKQDGQVAHRAARAGRPMELSAREVSVTAIDLIGLERTSAFLDVEVAISCGPGTYIRSIARDLGELLGSGGYLASLRRTRAAGLDIASAVTPDELLAMATAGHLADAILPLAPLVRLPHLTLAGDDLQHFVHGRPVHLNTPATDGRHLVLDGSTLIGIGTLRGGMLQPDKVLPPEASA